MNTVREKKGFTLAELLIVVAIIGVLVTISIPVFSGQRKKAVITTNLANIRSAKAVATADYIEYEDGKRVVYVYEIKNGKLTSTITSSGLKWDRNTCVVVSDEINTIPYMLYARSQATVTSFISVNDNVMPYIVVYITPSKTVTYPYYNSDTKQLDDTNITG